MDRRVSRAVLLTAIFTCVLIAGCHSGGTTTTPLAVITTALAPGTENTPYSATLEATGGTSPYTWSQVSGGNMPPGITLDSTGTFTGSPTKTGTFGPYTFKVTDANNDVATSSGISLTVNSNSLSVSTASLPNGVVGTAYSFKLAATGGASPYSWSETSGGTMPPGLATVNGDGVIAGNPTTAGTYGPYVFTVTDTKGTTAASTAMTITVTGTAAAVCTPQGNEGALTSTTPYAFLLKGTDGNGSPIDIAGSFTPNGTGGITAAAADYNGFSNGPEPLEVDLSGSSYSFSTSAQGCLYLSFSGLVSADVRKARTTPSRLDRTASTATRKVKPAIAAVPVANVLFSFYLGASDGTIYHSGRIIESDNTTGKGTNTSGFLQVQTPSAFVLSSLQANYAFGVDGWTATTSASALRTAMAGTFTNSSGTLSAGFADLNVGGTASGEMTGGYGVLNSTIDTTTGRGTGSYFTTTPTGPLTFDFAFYILNASDLILLSTDLANDSSSSPLLAGRALASNASSTTGSFAGYYLLASEGFQSVGTTTGNLAQLGTLNADGNGNIPTASIYANDAGTYTTNQYPAGTYTVETASGRVSPAGLLATSSPIFYLTAGTGTDDEIAAFLVGTDPQASSGVVVTQTSTPPAYSLGSVTGNYVSSTEEDIDGNNGAFLGDFSFNGTGGYSVTTKTTATVPSIPNPGSIAVNADGSGNLNGGNFPLVTNGTVVFVIPDSGDPLLFVLVSATAP